MKVKHPLSSWRASSQILIALQVFVCIFLLSSCSTNSSQSSPASSGQTNGEQSSSASELEPTGDDQPELTEQALHYKKSCKKDIVEAKKLYQQLETQTFRKGQKLLDKLNRLEIVVDRVAGKASLFRNVHPDPEIRKLADTCQQEIYELVTEIGLSKPIYENLSKFSEEEFSGLDKRYFKDSIESFERSGVDLDDESRAKIKSLNNEILKQGQAFNQNIREDKRSIWIDPKRLAGLPEDYISAKAVNEEGKVEITTDYPDYIPIMQYAHDDSLRLEMYTLFRNRAYPSNESVLKALITKRDELAQVLGFENYAQYVTADKMIESADNAQNFINKINQAAAHRSQQDYQTLLQRLKEIDPKAKEVGDWQKTYLENLIRSETYEVDAQEVRQYFAYGNVKQGIFDLVEAMFQVQIKPWKTEVWHPSVKAYELWDGKELLGQFYLDMHPREGKYNHAAAFGIREGVQGIQTPISALVCNFPGEKDPGELMEHAQVETFLHEFGHLIHGIFGGHQPYLSMSGISTERDFVEAPSQMLEEWVWDPETLKTFARNKKGELIPDELIKKMNNGREFGKGIFTRHQMFYAALSLSYYNTPPAQLNLDQVMVDLQQRYSPFAYVPDTHFYTSFGHLYGYSAIYYTYMWSLVIAADMFAEFEREGLRNTQLAQRYRRYVLEPGGSKDAAELVKDFLGREYNFKAFEKSLNQNN